MGKITAEDWEKAVRHAIAQEDLYAQVDEIDQLNPLCPPDDEVIEPAEEEKEILKCENCDFQSDNPGAFKTHTNSIKKCEHCPKLFCGTRSIDKLKTHKKEHNYKPKTAHICTQCKKAFQNPSRLKQHLVWSKCGRSVGF